MATEEMRPATLDDRPMTTTNLHRAALVADPVAVSTGSDDDAPGVALLPGGPARAGGRSGRDVVLRDGSTVRVRAVCGEDEAAMLGFLRELSPQTRGLRFFTAGPDLTREASRSVAVDGSDAYGLLATVGSAGEIVGHAGYVSQRPGCAEVAFAIATPTRGTVWRRCCWAIWRRTLASRA